MRLGRVCSLMILAWLFVGVRSECERTRNVFVLHMENSQLPLNIAASNAIQEIIGRQPGIQIYEEYLDESRLGTDFAVVADAIKKKYAGQQMDLIMTIGPQALRFLLQYGNELWPSVPKVFSDVEEQPKQLPPDVTGVYGLLRFAPTLDLALRLQPDTQHIYYLGGASPAELWRRDYEKKEFEPYTERLDFTYMNDLSLPQILDRISRLPGHSIALFTVFFKDASGEAFVSAKVAPLVAIASNAPVYGSFDTLVGSGIVGGNIFDLKSHARQAAVLGLKILRGEAVADLPVEEGPQNNFGASTSLD